MNLVVVVDRNWWKMNTQPTDSLGNLGTPNSTPVNPAQNERADTDKTKVGSDDTAVASPTAAKTEGDKKIAASPITSDATPPKKKRKSPEKPWKKPPDMPKRPLSAYNLFFQDEKNRLKEERKKSKGQNKRDGAKEEEDEKTKQKPGGKRKHVAVSGIGFANLAKTVAAKWKSLDDATREPYMKRAAVDKARYDKEVAAWREKEKEKKALEKANKNQAATLSPLARHGPDFFDIPPTQSDAQSLASLSAIEHPADWFQTSTGSPHDDSVPPQIQTYNEDPSRAYASSGGGRLSPVPGSYSTGHYHHYPNLPPTMSPLGESTSPMGSSYGAQIFHNQPSGMQGSGAQIPPFPGTHNSYSFSNNPSGGRNGPYNLSFRRTTYMQPSQLGGQDFGRRDNYEMQQMQQSSMPQPLQAFPDLNDPFPINEGGPLQHQQQQQQQPSIQVPQSQSQQRQGYPFNPMYDSYQEQAPSGPFQNSQLQQHNSQFQPHNSQYQQQQHPQQQYVANMQHQFQQQPMQHSAPSMQQQLEQPQHAPNQRQPNELFDESMMEYFTRLRDGGSGDGSPSRRHNFP